MSVLNITKDNFQKEIIESEKTVLLDFWAGWCGPCRMLSPIVDEIAGEREDIKVAKINVELAAAFQVMSTPTLVVMKDGKIVSKTMGVRPKKQVLSLLP